MMATEEGRRRGLGRGLSALLGDEGGEAQAEAGGRIAQMMPVEHLQAGRYQPRKRFDDEAFTALVDSVRARGVLQPLLVRRDEAAPGHYEIVAGERRWRAAQRAQLHEVPVIVKELSDVEALEIALVENLQREDLTPLEEAEAYRRLMEEFSHTQEVLSQAVGKSRSHVANMIRLLGLPEPVRRMLDDGDLSAGHARTLVNVTDPESLAREIVRRGLNVRQTEDLARREKSGGAKKPGGAVAKDPNIVALEREIADSLGLKVKVSAKTDSAGKLTVQYESLEQLDELVHRLKTNPEGTGC